jgi:DNA-binding protein HU-beta
MNQHEFIEDVSNRIGSKREGVLAVRHVLAALKDAVNHGEKVTLSGFGVFEKQVRAPRTARNPSNGQLVQVPEKARPRFRPLSAFVISTQAAHEEAKNQTPA